MLDFNQLMQQIDSINRDSFAEQEDRKEKLKFAAAAMEKVAADPEAFLEKVERSMSSVLWPVATPLEDLGGMEAVPPSTLPATVIGVDGSQIMPSHHEVHNCYLLNIGYAVISYGSQHKPILETYPRLFHRPEDLYPLVDRRRFHIDELYVSLERNLLEMETLCRLAEDAASRGLPIVALLDGSLIPWSVEKLSGKYQQYFLRRLEEILQKLEEYRVPLIGYLSGTRATDVVNMLRVSLCPYDVSNCQKHCRSLVEKAFPCSTIWPLADRQLFLANLAKFHRSCIFLSDAAVTKSWSSLHRICFSYLNVGAEIARLEFPRSLMADRNLLKFALSAVVSQVEKGIGYPVALSEAHHLAVIKGTERERFFRLLAARMIDLGLTRVQPSPKESRKRVGFV